MAALISFGELLIDMLAMPDGTFRPFPGGAPANVAVGFAQLGGKAYFAGGLGEDAFARQLKAALIQYQVDTRFLCFVKDSQTALAFVHLDQDNERSFTFYRKDTADIAVTFEHFKTIDWQQAEIFHFCSNTMTHPPIAEVTRKLVSEARAQRCLISFDVNLRPRLWSCQADITATVESCLTNVDIVKLSVEELDFLSQQSSLKPADYLTTLLDRGIKVVVLSDGPRPTQLITNYQQVSLKPPKVCVKDTTAAGDAMVAGLLFYLSLTAAKQQCNLHNLLRRQQVLVEATQFALQCGAVACSSLGAFNSLPTLDDVVSNNQLLTDLLNGPST